MTNNSIMLDLNDPKAAKIAEVISNKTAKKIIGSLVEKDQSASDLSRELNLPLNTVTYNLKKLVSSGLVDKSKNFFWSRKGNKIEIYKISNKQIVISPKKMIKGIIPTIFASGIFALGIKYFSKRDFVSETNQRSLASGSNDALIAEAAPMVADGALYSSGDISLSLVFLAGALFAMFVFLILNWRYK